MSNNAWIAYVKKVQNENNCSYKEALQLASKTYKKGQGIKQSNRAFVGAFKKMGNDMNRGFQKMNPFNDKKFNRVGAVLGKTTNDDLLPFVQQVGTEAYDKTLMALDPITGNMATPLGRELYNQMGRKYVRQPKNPIARQMAMMTKEGVKYSKLP